MEQFWQRLVDLWNWLVDLFRRTGGSAPQEVRASRSVDLVSFGSKEVLRAAKDRRVGRALYIPDHLEMRVSPDDLAFLSSEERIRRLREEIEEKVGAQATALAKRKEWEYIPAAHGLQVRLVETADESPSARAWFMTSEDGATTILDLTTQLSPDAQTGPHLGTRMPRLLIAYDGRVVLNIEAALGMVCGRDPSNALLIPPDCSSVSRVAAYIRAVRPDEVDVWVTNRFGAQLVGTGVNKSIPEGEEGMVTLRAGETLYFDRARRVGLQMEPR